MLLLPKSKSSGSSLNTLIKAFWHVLKEHNKRHSWDLWVHCLWPAEQRQSFWNWLTEFFMHDFYLELPTSSYTFLFAFFKPAPFIMTFTGLRIAGHEQFSQRIFLGVLKKKTWNCICNALNFIKWSEKCFYIFTLPFKIVGFVRF